MHSEKGSATRYRLAIRRPQRQVVWFSDRPVRRSGTFPARDLARDWAGFGFGSDPPNVAVDYVDSQGRSRTAIVVLRKPRLHGREIVFTAHLRQPGAVRSGNLAAHAVGADATPPRRMRRVALFIDDGLAPVAEGCILQPHTVCLGVTLRAAANYAQLTGAVLIGATIEESRGLELNEADLTNAQIYGTLYNTNFEDANLTGAGMEGDFDEVALIRANLTNANLNEASFFGSILEGANTTGALMESTKYCDTQLPNGTFAAPCPNNGS
jgi:hypothetical protein